MHLSVIATKVRGAILASILISLPSSGNSNSLATLSLPIKRHRLLLSALIEGLNDPSAAPMSAARFSTNGGKEESGWTETKLSTIGPSKLKVKGKEEMLESPRTSGNGFS